MRAGHVPNAVYSCGGRLRNHQSIIPCATSDDANAFVNLSLDEVLAAME